MTTRVHKTTINPFPVSFTTITRHRRASRRATMVAAASTIVDRGEALRLQFHYNNGIDGVMGSATVRNNGTYRGKIWNLVDGNDNLGIVPRRFSSSSGERMGWLTSFYPGSSSSALLKDVIKTVARGLEDIRDQSITIVEPSFMPKLPNPDALQTFTSRRFDRPVYTFDTTTNLFLAGRQCLFSLQQLAEQFRSIAKQLG